MNVPDSVAGQQEEVSGVARIDRNERGATSVFFALFLLALLGFFAVAADVGLLYQVRAQLQGAADASALAGASALPDTAATRAQVLAYANLNAPAWGTIFMPNEIVFGNWDSLTNVFTPTGTNPNAVRV